MRILPSLRQYTRRVTQATKLIKYLHPTINSIIRHEGFSFLLSRYKPILKSLSVISSGSMIMMKFSTLGILIAATIPITTADKLLPPYFEDLIWEASRSLSNWSNLTVETRTGRFVGMLNDTYPNVRQFLRVPFAKVSFHPKYIYIYTINLTSLLHSSHPSVIFAGCPRRNSHPRAENMMPQSTAPVRYTKMFRIDPLLIILFFSSQLVRSMFNVKTRSGRTTNRVAL